MKVCIYGAGAIGTWLGAGLSQAGCMVSVVARGAALAAIQSQGLQRIDANCESSFKVVASDTPADLGVQDLIIIAVKAPAMASIAEQLAPLMHGQTVVMTAMNGVPWWFLNGFGGQYAGTRLQAIDASGSIAAAIPAANIIGCVVHASCSVPSAGVVQHHFGNGLIIGETNGEPTPRVQALAALLVKAGFNASVSDQIQKDVWFKLWGNMTVNPISALTGATTDKILDDDLLRGFVSNVMLEAKAIGEHLGIAIAQVPDDRHAVTRKLGAFKTSMLQDAEAGKGIELDALVTAVRELGVVTGVATPFTDALLGLSRVFARQRGIY
jgi:2-dehydropantoate 2-reductase